MQTKYEIVLKTDGDSVTKKCEYDRHKSPPLPPTPPPTPTTPASLSLSLSVILSSHA